MNDSFSNDYTRFDSQSAYPSNSSNLKLQALINKRDSRNFIKKHLEEQAKLHNFSIPFWK